MMIPAQADPATLAALQASDAGAGSALLRQLLAALGEDPQRPGLEKTPQRAFKGLLELCSGYHGPDPAELLGGALYPHATQDLVCVRGIEFYSLCEHHLLPFFGHCHIVYRPAGRIVGLSKLPRLVELYSRRLQLQEQLARQIVEELQRQLAPAGAVVLIEAQHLCMMMRGVRCQGSSSRSLAASGCFEQPAQRAEALDLLRGPG